jgi:hypothetical protein
MTFAHCSQHGFGRDETKVPETKVPETPEKNR